MHVFSHRPTPLLRYGLGNAKGLGRHRLTLLGTSGQSSEESTAFSHPAVDLHLCVTTVDALSLISVIGPGRLVTHPSPGTSVQW